jgi:N-sulfoglucosamine sulfohydrolase
VVRSSAASDVYKRQALRKLEALGELDNTLIVVTSDHGMPFPRVKGQIYEDGFHIPLAVRWGSAMKGGRTINDFITTRDFAPTILEAAGVKAGPTFTGKSFVDILRSGKQGVVDPTREFVMVAKERHDIGRPNDAGYPVRAIRTRQYLYIRNYTPDVWPAGMPETGYRDVDDSPTKTLLISSFDRYYKLSFGKRPAEELYDVEADPGCLKNLYAEPSMTMVKRNLRDRMEKVLKEEGDPRMNGNAAFFDTIQYTGPRKHSYENWLKNQ